MNPFVNRLIKQFCSHTKSIGIMSVRKDVDDDILIHLFIKLFFQGPVSHGDDGNSLFDNYIGL
jgi:hypothetical protein